MDPRTEYLATVFDVCPRHIASWLTATCPNAAAALTAARQAGVRLERQPEGRPSGSGLH